MIARRLDSSLGGEWEDAFRGTNGATIVREWAAELLTNQLGAWGRDVESPSGNLLVRYGFARTAPPEGMKVPSLYRFALPREASVLLRGFGVFYFRRGCGGLFLQRDEFAPRFTASAEPTREPWRIEDVPQFLPARSAEAAKRFELMFELLDWIASYETRIVAEQGLEYRRGVQAVLDARRTKPTRLAITAENLSERWRELAAFADRHPHVLLRDAAEPSRATQRRLARRPLIAERRIGA
ncbi:MAG TPA: hypothetical protein VGE52_03320 [Pirellulales bacterium]